MNHFSQLVIQLDQSSKSRDRIAAILTYLHQADDEDKLWMVALLSGKYPPRAVKMEQLKQWAMEKGDVPVWLFEASLAITQDGLETLSLILPAENKEKKWSLPDAIQAITSCRGKEEKEQKELVFEVWSQLEGNERWVWNKLLTGRFRLKIPTRVMAKALAQYVGREVFEIAHILATDWQPEGLDWDSLFTKKADALNATGVFSLCQPQQLPVSEVSQWEPADWLLEWWPEGQRAQLRLEENVLSVWTAKEELLKPAFLSIKGKETGVPQNLVMDGFLQKDQKQFLVMDVLMISGQDMRMIPLVERRKKLEDMLRNASLPQAIRLSEVIEFDEWSQVTELRAFARDYQAQGLLIRKAKAAYPQNESHTDWWVWEAEALRLKGVLLYARRGAGGVGRYGDYSFGLWKAGEWVTFAKTNIGLSPEETAELDSWIQANTQERFGPVRSVPAVQVFDIAFDSLRRSRRHKSGAALQGIRILKWCKYLSAEAADQYEALEQLLNRYAGPPPG